MLTPNPSASDRRLSSNRVINGPNGMLNCPDPVGRRSDLRTSFKSDHPPPYVRVCSLAHRVLDAIVFHRRVTDRATLRSQSDPGAPNLPGCCVASVVPGALSTAIPSGLPRRRDRRQRRSMNWNATCGARIARRFLAMPTSGAIWWRCASARSRRAIRLRRGGRESDE